MKKQLRITSGAELVARNCRRAERADGEELRFILDGIIEDLETLLIQAKEARHSAIAKAEGQPARSAQT